MTGTAVVEQTSLSPVEAYVARILPPGKRGDIAAALPSHVPLERFERNLANAVMAQPRLRDCAPNDVFFEVMKLAALGLLLDPQLGEAYLIADGNKKVQARVGYRGLLKLAKQSDVVANVYAHDICRDDRYGVTLGTNKQLVHEVDYLQPRGEVGAYYAVVEFKEGPPDFEVMTLEEVRAIRDRSDAWRAFKAGKIKSTPWGTDEGEMSKKTVLRRLLKRVPMAPERAEALAHLLAREDAAEFGHMRDVTPRASTLSQRLSGPSGQGFNAGHVESETRDFGGDQSGGCVDPGEGQADGGSALVGEADQGRRGSHAADQQPSHEGDDADQGEGPTEAYLRGRDARREGVGLKAQPGEYCESEPDAADWKAGWQDEDSAQKGGRK